MRIPVVICHGTNRGPYFTPKPRWRERPPLTAAHFEGYLRIAAGMGCRSISYDDLAAWRFEGKTLPERPIMFDFDHPNRSIGAELWPLMQRYGFTGNLFINTGAMEKEGDRRYLTWDEISAIAASRWQIGSHLHHHISLAYLARKDPSGALIREEMERCDGILLERLGVVSQDFAYTTTTWSAAAEREVAKRYRFARMWIIGSHFDTDAGRVRIGEFAGVAGDDESDGGPPIVARYIGEDTHPYRLPSMDMEYLAYAHDAFRRYLEGAVGAAAH
jgi:peptidoglycan/xylan/chitin deacetylase (PgdA/CDA1 family)